jgi:Glycosyl transferase family 64 domain
MHGFDTVNGHSRYYRWQHSWWTGSYSIMLTKAAFLHRDYLQDYMKLVPSSDTMSQFVDNHRNCEDLVMAFIVGRSSSAPVWVRATVYEISKTGISSGSSHFADRGECLDKLHEWALRGGVASDRKNSWVIGYQKVIAITLFDAFNLWK